MESTSGTVRVFTEAQEDKLWEIFLRCFEKDTEDSIFSEAARHFRWKVFLSEQEKWAIRENRRVTAVERAYKEINAKHARQTNSDSEELLWQAFLELDEAEQDDRLQESETMTWLDEDEIDWWYNADLERQEDRWQFFLWRANEEVKCKTRAIQRAHEIDTNRAREAEARRLQSIEQAKADRESEAANAQKIADDEARQAAAARAKQAQSDENERIERERRAEASRLIEAKAAADNAQAQRVAEEAQRVAAERYQESLRAAAEENHKALVQLLTLLMQQEQQAKAAKTAIETPLQQQRAIVQKETVQTTSTEIIMDIKAGAEEPVTTGAERLTLLECDLVQARETETDEASNLLGDIFQPQQCVYEDTINMSDIYNSGSSISSLEDCGDVIFFVDNPLLCMLSKTAAISAHIDETDSCIIIRSEDVCFPSMRQFSGDFLGGEYLHCVMELFQGLQDLECVFKTFSSSHFPSEENELADAVQSCLAEAPLGVFSSGKEFDVVSSSTVWDPGGDSLQCCGSAGKSDERASDTDGREEKPALSYSCLVVWPDC